MNKNIRYWILGIAAAIVVLAVIGFTAWNRRTPSPSESEATGISSQSGSNASMDQNAMDHNNMDHSGIDHSDLSDTAGGNTDDDNLKNYLKDQDSIMAEMMERMADIPHSGNASIDFLYGMIPHHESAIDMAESYLTYGGENSELKTLAENIIETQQKEITQMQDLIQKYQEDGQTDEDKEAAYLEEYNQMFTGHSHHIDTAGTANVDQAFAEGMIMHHQMAVDMAKSILEYTDYEEIRSLSQGIIKVQEKEIEEMQAYTQS